MFRLKMSVVAWVDSELIEKLGVAKVNGLDSKSLEQGASLNLAV